MTFDELGKAFQTLGEFVPIRREGEEIPDAPNGRFSIQWFHGPVLRFRRGKEIITMSLTITGLK
jgi:hypothetical protein